MPSSISETAKTVAVHPSLRVSSVSGRHRSLLLELVIMQFKLKDQSTLLGFGWSFLNPLLTLGCLFLFFNRQIGRGIDHYGLYLLIGLVQFTHFSNSTTSAMNVLAVMRRLTCDTIFPKELLVIATVITSSIELVVSMVLCIAIATLSGVALHATIALLPLVVLAQVVLVLWLSLLLSTVYVFATDSTHIYQVFLRILFFVTPTFYGTAFLDNRLARGIVLLNPLARLIEFSRTVILGGQPFPVTPFIVLVAVNIGAIPIALSVFRKYEPLFAERL
jgi:homopolymeric O-antigen transport system permease protein